MRLALLPLAPGAVCDAATARDVMAANAARIAAWIAALAPVAAPDLWLLPSLALTGHRRKDRGVPLDAVLAPIEELFAPVIDALARHGGVLCTTVQERLPALPGRVLHCGVLLDGSGVLLRSPKVQDFGAPGMAAVREILDEYRAALGDAAVWPSTPVAAFEVACLVGSESLVPEAVRLLAGRGVSLVLQPLSGAADADRPLPFALMQQASAYANGVFIASCGAPAERLDGAADPSRYAPHSLVAGPDGRLLAEVRGAGEGATIVDIDPQAIGAARTAQAADTTPAWELYAGFYQGAVR
jgi:predicted amidohydrolase